MLASKHHILREGWMMIIISIHLIVLQTIHDPVCVSSLAIQCTRKSKVDISKCLHPCSGLVVASFQKEDVAKNLENLFPLVIDGYNKYKIITQVPHGYQSNLWLKLYDLDSWIILTICLGSEWKNKLRFVKIYFDTPTFDRIEKDRAAKFMDMLSAIGGTMGLLSGFSIISGVEILYFTFKIMWNLI